MLILWDMILRIVGIKYGKINSLQNYRKFPMIVMDCREFLHWEAFHAHVSYDIFSKKVWIL